MEACHLLPHGIFQGFPRIGHRDVINLHRYTKIKAVATKFAVAVAIAIVREVIVRVYFP